VVLTTHPQLAPGSRMSRAIPLLPLWAFMACYREIFTFTYKNKRLYDCVFKDIMEQECGRKGLRRKFINKDKASLKEQSVYREILFLPT
jgi:hypothetical protein